MFKCTYSKSFIETLCSQAGRKGGDKMMRKYLEDYLLSTFNMNIPALCISSPPLPLPSQSALETTTQRQQSTNRNPSSHQSGVELAGSGRGRRHRKDRAPDMLLSPPNWDH